MEHPCRQALIVDDDTGLREVIADALRLEEIEAVPVRGAAEAIAALDGGCRPNIILLDLLMPGVSGERLLSMLRQHPGAYGIPIIAMSASPERLARIDGPDARLAKPFDLETLFDTMRRLCTRSDTGRLVLGISLVDSEHQRQLDLADALAEELRGGHETRHAARLLDDLIDCTRYHFSSEGELMRRHGYPGSAPHLSEHARCVTGLEQWRAASAAPTASLTVPDAMAVRASIEVHIRTMDRDLARYLAARGNA
jgi:hemerythrin-like metal-binding protein